MPTVTVVRRIPAPIIGLVGQVPDHAFGAFEETLDSLEAAGVVVERIDPVESPTSLARHPEAATIFAAEGEACLPLIVVDARVVSQGKVLDRARLAHLLALETHAHPEVTARLAAIAADAALGDAVALRADSVAARALGIADEDIDTAVQVGASRHVRQNPSRAV